MPRTNRPRFIALVERLGHVQPDLADSAAAIRSGMVMVNRVIVTNPASRVPADAAIKLRRPRPPRGQLKLAAALDAFDVAVRSRTAADIGASIGGFTLALLSAGARRVYAVDAGHGQLLGRLRLDPRVVNLEATNLANLHPRLIPEPIEVITVDLSYLALADAAPQLEALTIAPGADLVALVKPMYELGLAAPPDSGALRQKAVEQAASGFEQCGWRFCQAIESPVLGSHGSIEHLAHFHRRGEASHEDDSRRANH